MSRPHRFLVIERTTNGETVLTNGSYSSAVTGLRSRQSQFPLRDFRMIKEHKNSSMTPYSKSQGSGSAGRPRKPAQQWDVVSPSGGTRSKQAQSKAKAKIDNILRRLQSRPLLLADREAHL